MLKYVIALISLLYCNVMFLTYSESESINVMFDKTRNKDTFENRQDNWTIHESSNQFVYHIVNRLIGSY